MNQMEATRPQREASNRRIRGTRSATSNKLLISKTETESVFPSDASARAEIQATSKPQPPGIAATETKAGTIVDKEPPYAASETTLKSKARAAFDPIAQT